MKKTMIRIMNTVLILALGFGLFRFIGDAVQSRRSRQDYEQALQIVTGQTAPQQPVQDSAAEEPTEALPPDEQEEDVPAPEDPAPEEQSEEAPPIPDDPYIEELLTYDIRALQEENEDVIGWIMIPDTNISFPLLQWTDNEFYLSHSWDQSKNNSGSIFMEWQNSPDLTDFNTIIYGHNMSRVNMFGSLHSYRNPKYFAEHPHVYILISTGVYRYDVFATRRADVDSIVYGLGIESDYKKEELIRYSVDYSDVDSDIVPTIEDRLLTLSTCSGQGYSNRWIVQCVLNEEASYILDEPMY